MNQQCILSTCGIGLLTNGADADLRGMVTRHANAKASDDVADPAERERLLRHIEEQRNKLVEATNLADVQRMSPELNSVVRLYASMMTGHGGDYHILVCTDTWLGSETARIIEGWLRSHGLNVDVWRISDLQTARLEYFSLGMSELVRRCHETLPGYRENRYRVIFNLTGGFKSVQGFLQTLGLFYADESVYTFESGEDLLRLPRLPIELDAGHILRDNLRAVRRGAMSLSLADEDQERLCAPLFMTIDGDPTLSPWGELLWQQQSKTILGEALLPPVSEKLEYGAGLAKSVAHLNAERMAQINQKLDWLARYLETGQALNGLDFKDLKTNVKAPSTHECDAWHDEAAMRLYGHYEDGRFVVDELGQKLPSKK